MHSTTFGHTSNSTLTPTQCKKTKQRNSRTIHLLKHLEHPINIIMVQKPRLRVLLVLLERDPERVRHIDRLAVVLPQENAYDAL